MSASHFLAPRPPATFETVHNILCSLVARYHQEEVLTAVRQIPARDAKFRPIPDWVASALAEAYRAKGIRELYSHQASTADLVRQRKNVVVVTPTASGKTLCYNLPVLNAVLENSDTRALYLFPTKALAQDQLAELQDLATRLNDSFGVFTYDGDTPSDARKAIRERGHIVLTNPDMLHTGMHYRPPPSARTSSVWPRFSGRQQKPISTANIFRHALGVLSQPPFRLIRAL